MQVEDILSLERCVYGLNGVSKKRVINKISDVIAANTQQLELDSTEVFNALMAREQLGSTGLGNGIAIPHCRVDGCEQIVGALISLEDPVDFDAVDGKPVDLLFALVVPQQKNDEHLQTLAGLAELFADEDFCYTLRHTHDSEDLYNIAITY